MSRRPLGAAALAVAGAAAALALSAARPEATRTPAPAALPLVAPAFVPGASEPAPPARWSARWAPVRRATVARLRPSAAAGAVAPLPRRTPEGTPNIVRVLASRPDAGGRVWVRVTLATLPNGRTGWVRRRALGGYATVDTRLVVDLGRLTATLWRRGLVVFRARVGVGQDRSPTPRGRFIIRNELTRFASPAYGPLAFGTNARSERATDWPGGGYVGIHGTDRPDLVPGHVSHGCIRMRNADIRALARLMPVGTPLTIS